MSAVGSTTSVLAVVDSGSPVTVADPAFLRLAGIDLIADEPVMELPLGPRCIVPSRAGVLRGLAAGASS